MEIKNGELTGVTKDDIQEDGSFIYPQGVTVLGNVWPFYNCKKLTTVVIPQSVTKICYGSMDGLTNLTSIIDVDDDDEYKRIKALFPLLQYFQNNVIKMATYDKAKAIQKEALEELCKEPRVNNFYSYAAFAQWPLFTDFFCSLNTFLASDSRYYKEAKKGIAKIKLPTTEDDLADYKANVFNVVDEYANLAQKHKKSQPECRANSTGWPAMFQTVANEQPQPEEIHSRQNKGAIS